MDSIDREDLEHLQNECLAIEAAAGLTSTMERVREDCGVESVERVVDRQRIPSPRLDVAQAVYGAAQDLDISLEQFLVGREIDGKPLP